MGVYQRPKSFTEAVRVRQRPVPRPRATAQAQRAGSLSGGERQMVAMGRALMMEPSVLLLDEPSAGLSPVLQDEVFVQTRRINRAGVSVIMVEQNARRCLQICDRGYVLDQGRNAYTAEGKDLIERPQGDRALPGHAGRQQAADLAPRGRSAAGTRHVTKGPTETVGPLRRTAVDQMTPVTYFDRSCSCCQRRTGRCRWWPWSGYRCRPGRTGPETPS